MIPHRILLLVAATGALAACEGRSTPDKTRDQGTFGATALAEDLTPGIWVDLNGCEHWLVDDGVEGYLSPRFDPHTRLPVCGRNTAPPTYVTGPFRDGADVGDSI